MGELEPITIGFIAIGILVVLLALRMYIAFCLLLVGYLGFAFLAGPEAAMGMLGLVPYRMASSILFMAVPMFMLMGTFAGYSEITTELFDFAHKWLGRLPGGLAMAAVFGCAAFAAVSGSAAATAAATTTSAASSPGDGTPVRAAGARWRAGRPRLGSFVTLRPHRRRGVAPPAPEAADLGTSSRYTDGDTVWEPKAKRGVRMVSVTVKIPEKAHATSAALAAEQKRPMSEVLADLIEQERRRAFFAASNAAFARLKADPIASSSYVALQPSP